MAVPTMWATCAARPSCFVLPGAQRVLCAATRQDLETTAFVNPDASIAIIALNRTEQAIAFKLSAAGQYVITELPARSIATYLVTD
jgi:glucosylceramidase